MKRVFAMAICAACMAPAVEAADLGVSLQFSQPGVFGRIDIGQYPQPQVIVTQPVLVAPPPAAVPVPEPVYLWVPPEHRAHWERHCREYHACGHPVYFVDHEWYRQNVLARQARSEERYEDEHHRQHGRSEEEHGHHGDHDDGDRGRGHD